VLDASTVVQSALLQREMRFREWSLIQIFSNFIAGVSALIAAFAGLGVWSLVIQALIASVTKLSLTSAAARFFPKLALNRTACRELVQLSGYIFGFDVINYWSRSIDRLLIGRIVGATALGLYSRAYSLMLLPLTQVSQVFGRVMLPALSEIQEDKERVKRVYLEAITFIALLTFPMMASGFVLSAHLILGLLGEPWRQSIPLFRIFCAVGMIQSIGTTVGWIYLSQGKTKLYFQVGSVFSILNLFAISIGIQSGIRGVAWAYLVFNLLVIYPAWTIPARLIGLTFFEIIASLAPISCASILMGVIIYMTMTFIPLNLGHLLLATVSGSAGFLIYIIALYSTRPKCWTQATETLHRMLTRHPRLHRKLKFIY
jgi:PST family polysaccharide transporter